MFATFVRALVGRVAHRGRRRGLLPIVAAAIVISGCSENPSETGSESDTSTAGLPGAAAATDSTGRSYTLRPIVPVGSPFHGVHGLRFGSNGTLYAASVIGQSLFEVDIETGTIDTLIPPPQGMSDDIAIAADGTMVWTAIENGILYARAPDGTVRRVLEGYKGVNAVAFHPDGRRLFMTLVFYGDALYEVDIYGGQPPRLIAEDLGGLNAFEVAPDGTIYGPLVFGAAVVHVDPDTGSVETVSDDFISAGALKLESATSALVLDNGEHIKRVDLLTGETTTIATMPAEADNLAIDADGRVFVSLSETNAIVELDTESGSVSYIVGPAPLNSPAGFAVGKSGGRDTLYVGDLFGGIKIVDVDSGSIRHQRVELFQPSRIAVDGDTLLAVSQVFGTIERFSLDSFDVLETWEGFTLPGEVIPGPDGDLIVADSGSGAVVRAGASDGGERQPLVVGLDFPMGLAAGPDGTIYVSETGAGRIIRIAPDGAVAILAAGLGQPEGIAIGPDGRLLVVDVAERKLLAIDVATGTIDTLTGDLPIGHANGPSLFRDVAVDADRIIITSDVDNTLYELVISG